MRCPKCGEYSLFVTPILKYKNTGRCKIVGEEEWCIRRNCNYQEEIKNYVRL